MKPLWLLERTAKAGYQELIATEATGNIVFIAFLRNPLSHLDQELISCFVAELIVNDFKIIQIDKRNKDVALAVAGLCKQRCQLSKIARRFGKPVNASVYEWAINAALASRS